jgi:hypothetical protein
MRGSWIVVVPCPRPHIAPSCVSLSQPLVFSQVVCILRNVLGHGSSLSLWRDGGCSQVVTATVDVIQVWCAVAWPMAGLGEWQWQWVGESAKEKACTGM